MKKVAIVTFHRAHNFGSVLQTYALQSYVKSLGSLEGEEIEYRVIDLFTEDQEQLYSVFKKNNCWKNFIKNIIVLSHANALKVKHGKFNAFIEKNFYLTKRYKNEEELRKEPPEADYYLSGSDQIWNVRAMDFSSSYYLDFVKGRKKISYSASFGPLKIDWSQYDEKKISSYLRAYDCISVREKGSADNIQKLIGQKCEIHVDPTLLLRKEQWSEIQSDANYNNGQYILLYCLEPSKEQLKMARAISKKLNLPILVLRYNNKNDIINGFVKRYDAGPKDFLAYMDNAALVLSSSFHGTAFSLIYHKPFYVFNGMNDKRISSLLIKTGMRERSLNGVEDIDRVSLNAPDGDVIESVLSQERKASRDYLVKVLELE